MKMYGTARITLRQTALVFAGLVWLAVPPAVAQDNGMPNALQGFSRNKSEPVKIESNKLEVRDKEKLAIFTGNVFVQQGDTTMRSPELRVFY
jgi:lipopolysaccharide export system protein LptA